jgi:hypothetical protein
MGGRLDLGPDPERDATSRSHEEVYVRQVREQDLGRAQRPAEDLGKSRDRLDIFQGVFVGIDESDVDLGQALWNDHARVARRDGKRRGDSNHDGAPVARAMLGQDQWLDGDLRRGTIALPPSPYATVSPSMEEPGTGEICHPVAEVQGQRYRCDAEVAERLTAAERRCNVLPEQLFLGSNRNAPIDIVSQQGFEGLDLAEIPAGCSLLLGEGLLDLGAIDRKVDGMGDGEKAGP